MDARKDARLDHVPETRDHGLLVRRHNVRSAQQPQANRGQCQPFPWVRGTRRAGPFLVRMRMMRMFVRMAVIVVMLMIVGMIVAVMMLYRWKRAHCAASPFISTFNSSESELRMAVVLSSRIFL